MPNGPYTGPLKVRVVPCGVSGEDDEAGRWGVKRFDFRKLKRIKSATCSNGHLYTPDNTKMVRNGHGLMVRKCVECDRIRKERYRSKRRV